MPETTIPVSDNLGRLLRTRAEKIAKGRYIPPIVRGANVYLIGFVILAVGSVLSGFYIDAAYHAEFWPALVHFLTTLLEALVGGLIATTMALWLQCDKVMVGRMGVYSVVDYDGSRAIYLYDNSTGRKPEELNLEVFEIVRFGQLIDKFFKGNGPVCVYPVMEQDEVEKILKKYRDDPSRRPELPDGVRFHGARKKGTTYVVEADFHPSLLGNEYGVVPEEIRNFIWERWPDLTAGCVVNMAWERLPADKEVETNLRTAGMTYELAASKAQLHAVKKTNEDILDVLEDVAKRTGGENV